MKYHSSEITYTGMQKVYWIIEKPLHAFSIIRKRNETKDIVYCWVFSNFQINILSVLKWYTYMFDKSMTCIKSLWKYILPDSIIFINFLRTPFFKERLNFLSLLFSSSYSRFWNCFIFFFFFFNSFTRVHCSVCPICFDFGQWHWCEKARVLLLLKHCQDFFTRTKVILLVLCIIVWFKSEVYWNLNLLVLPYYHNNPMYWDR